MELKLNSKEFEHIDELSTYNNNYYSHLKRDCTILEICHEDYNSYEFWLIENEGRIFLGCSNHGFGDADNFVIDFKQEYT